MAGFNEKGRIRSAVEKLSRQFKDYRSKRQKQEEQSHHIHEAVPVPVSSSAPASAIKRYRNPIIVTILGGLVIGAVAITGQQYVQANSIAYYNVSFNGEWIGEISDQQKIDELIKQKEMQLKQAKTEVLAELDDYELTYTVEKAYNKQVDDEATLSQVAGKLTTHPIGVKLYVEGELVGVVRDQKTASQVLQRVKNLYVPADLVKKSGTEVTAMSFDPLERGEADQAGETPKRVVTEVAFAENVATKLETLESTELTDLDELFHKLTDGEPVPRTYTVQKGDCVGCIALKLGISDDIIYDNNPWIVNDMIRVGDVLDLSTEDPPMLNVNSVEEVTEIETIDPPIEYVSNDDMKLGQTKVQVQGKEGQQEVTYRLIKRNGDTIDEEQVAVKILKEPTPTVILKGTKVIRGEGTGKFMWPVKNARITSYQGTRWGRYHKGIDMIGNSNILAADHGVVEFAGYKKGLGNTITINHKNGFKTVYGHMKSMKVSKGAVVEKGDLIGIMGSTGNSTGVHLHFEIYLNDKLKNPTSYL